MELTLETKNLLSEEDTALIERINASFIQDVLEKRVKVTNPSPSDLYDALTDTREQIIFWLLHFKAIKV